jgi:hypothetical protein
MLLTSCSAPGAIHVAQTTQVHYYPQCYQPVQALRDRDAQYQRSMMVNSLIGAGLGAAAGALISGNAKGALIGAAAGGAVAAAGTYAAYRMKTNPDDEQRRFAIAQDLQHDQGELQATVIAVRQAEYCYDTQFNTLRYGVSSGTISKPEARARFAEIQQGSAEIRNILAEYGQKARHTQGEYSVAFNQEAQRLNTTPEQLAAVASPPPPPPETAPAPRKASRHTRRTRHTPAKPVSHTPPPAPAQPASAVTMARSYQSYNAQVAQISELDQSMQRTETTRAEAMRGLGV